MQRTSPLLSIPLSLPPTFTFRHSLTFYHSLTLYIYSCHVLFDFAFSLSLHFLFSLYRLTSKSECSPYIYLYFRITDPESWSRAGRRQKDTYWLAGLRYHVRIPKEM